MRCDRIREALSARIDGEDPGLPDGELDAHLGVCAECRAWRQRAHAVTRRARLGGAFLEHDLTPAVLATAVGPPRWGSPRALRWTLMGLALAQFAIAAPMLFLGHDHDAGVHAAHELGSFNMALAVAFAVGAIRPALSAGLAWVCGFAAAGLVATAIADLISGQAIGAGEAQHLVAAAGAALLVWQAQAKRRGVAGPAIVPATVGFGPMPTAAEEDRIPGPDRLPDHPWGDDAARLAGPHADIRAVGQ